MNLRYFRCYLYLQSFGKHVPCYLRSNSQSDSCDKIDPYPFRQDTVAALLEVEETGTEQRLIE
jgi:hypothetical protein